MKRAYVYFAQLQNLGIALIQQTTKKVSEENCLETSLGNWELSSSIHATKKLLAGRTVYRQRASMPFLPPPYAQCTIC